MLKLKNVTKKYGGEYALRNVSLTISKGLNFIVGPSGSGKTTLLKIISGMEDGYDGEVTYCEKNIKDLTSKEKSSFYNHVFGFIWQDFNLLEDRTVLDNVLLPAYLNEGNPQSVVKVLKELRIHDLANQKVKFLSGGQKQRVAIARELMKNPKIIIADEPTSALDEQTSKAMMEVLRIIAKKRTVIMVTHDISLIQDKDNIYELDKGELVDGQYEETAKVPSLTLPKFPRLSIPHAFTLTKTNLKHKFGRYVIGAITMMIAGILLLTTFSGAIGKSQDGEFEKLLDTYGETILDISVIDSFTSAAGTGGKDNDNPNADVNQNIAGLYEKYAKDERVNYVLYMQPFNDIKITMNGKKHNIESSGGTPEMRSLLSGRMPASGHEIIVPESFVKKAGKDKESILNTEIEFEGSIFDWSSGEPVPKNARTKVTIVGVADTNMTSVYDGSKYEYSLDDSFFFSKDALDSLRKQAGVESRLPNFVIRAKNVNDLIEIKNELNKQGIVPLGQFELVEDIVKLNNQSAQQSGSASTMVGVLAMVMTVSIFLITNLLRKREYAIYKVSGFHNSHLHVLSLMEIIVYACTAILLMFVSSPLLNIMTNSLFGVDILSSAMLLKATGFIAFIAVIAYITSILTYKKNNISIILKTGNRQ